MAGQYPGKGVHAQHANYGLRGLRARVDEYRLDYLRIRELGRDEAALERAAARWASYADLLETVERLDEAKRVRTRTENRLHPIT
ncbi:hypothetical protein SALGADO_62 [Arthrobacter phage Salgado]|nr:hypothetical protein KMD21_gp59 [Arthrobacter phage LiSara]YP_010082671.1 hypothetical protein KMD22_gp62 [Arthrobacter phage Salgado]ALY10228.1 hypothetical protein SALGADO_62 [Arthrobacter phage Salgado]ASR83643.1 hypothetical protein SEA_LISARA_59 [Arthrobacter phage LiSara]